MEPWNLRDEVVFAHPKTEVWVFSTEHANAWIEWRKRNPNATPHEIRLWMIDHHAEVVKPEPRGVTGQGGQIIIDDPWPEGVPKS